MNVKYIKIILFSVICFCQTSSEIYSTSFAKVNLNRITVISHLVKVAIVHVIIPRTLELLKLLSGMDAVAYFDAIERIKIDYVNDFDLFEFQILPGQSLEKAPIEQTSFNGKEVIIFVRYDAPGINKLVLPNGKRHQSVVLSKGNRDGVCTLKR